MSDATKYANLARRIPLFKGISPEDAERMLQPFTRLSTARSGAGTGLGLAIVDRIARLHGGHVRLLPRDGGGLRVRVELPA